MFTLSPEKTQRGLTSASFWLPTSWPLASTVTISQVPWIRSWSDLALLPLHPIINKQGTHNPTKKQRDMKRFLIANGMFFLQSYVFRGQPPFFGQRGFWKPV